LGAAQVIWVTKQRILIAMNNDLRNLSSLFPSFDGTIPFLNQFILELVESYRAGKINSWDDLDERVKSFFTLEQMDKMEKLASGWTKMASYSSGITLTHVTCVFLGVYMLSEFQTLTLEQQQIAKWIVLLHDLDKFHIRDKKDTMHGFRSGVLAARTLPTLGFPITEKYDDLLVSWSESTLHAYIEYPGDTVPTPDNRKLPAILSGIDQMFGENTPASLIAKTVLLHISLRVDPYYPTPAPLTDTEIKQFITPSLFPFLKVMMMGDNEGWSLFEPEVRKRQYKDTLEAFERIQKIIASN
jgi:hypothetical protein